MATVFVAVAVPRSLATRAPAKINLTLHVLGRRSDGYHDLESLVAFAGAADSLSLEPGPDLALSVEGPTAGLAGEGPENLVLKAARLLAERVRGLRLGRFLLLKRLPVAAGIGGGSADAAAALRLLARHNGLTLDDPRLREAARRTGADVSVCLEPRARMMRGTGDEVGPGLALPPLFAVLLNPGVPMKTPAVFAELGLRPGTPLAGAPHPEVGVDIGMSASTLIGTLLNAGNDLEGPAIRLRPAIGEALEELRGTKRCRLARMSGSGATVFGLYETPGDAREAARSVRQRRAGWWVKATVLR